MRFYRVPPNVAGAGESLGHVQGSVVKLSKKNFFFKKKFYSVSKLSKKTSCYSVSGVSIQLRN